jgi:mono/diheme cytochrome c family protein
MRTIEMVAVALLISLHTSGAIGAGPGLGRPATSAEIAAIDISIPPSGKGLPAGSGNANTGAAVYAQKCASCHGAEGNGKPADKLVGGIGSLDSATPAKSVGSFWPYATTLFDYVRRSMPLNAPMTLTDDEVYAVTAYVLFLNGIVAQQQTMDAQSLPRVRMPNRDGFVDMSGVR